MSAPTRRRHNGLRIVDLTVLVAAAAVMIWACTGSWTRSSEWTCYEIVPTVNTFPQLTSKAMLSDEVLAETSRLLRGQGVSLLPGGHATPQQLRSVLTIDFFGAGSYEIQARTGDPAVETTVLDAWLVAVKRWLERHYGRSDDDDARFHSEVYHKVSPPEPFGAATPLVVAGMLFTAGLAVVWVLFRAWSYRKGVSETAVEPHVEAG